MMRLQEKEYIDGKGISGGGWLASGSKNCLSSQESSER
jgi:hypothetical protein